MFLRTIGVPRYGGPLKFEKCHAVLQMGSDGNAKAVIVEKARKKSDAKKRNQQVCALSIFPPSCAQKKP